MYVEMVIAGLTIDPVSNAPIVILREKEGERIVPIWVGAVEASAIAIEIEGVDLPRPMTHDLLFNALEALGGEVRDIRVSDLRDGTYYSVITLAREDHTIEVDSRPSDAIALALRAQAPILCNSEVIELARGSDDKSEKAVEAASQGDAVVDAVLSGAQSSPDEAAESQQGGDSESESFAQSVASEGPRPLVDVGDRSTEGLLESLDPEAFGKYKM